MYATFYCTHSIGPLIHITGLRPVSVTGFEMPFNARMARMGAKAGSVGIEMITLENGAILKSIHGVGPSRNSVWYSIYGSKGRMECAREDAKAGHVGRLYVNYTNTPGDYENPQFEDYEPKPDDAADAIAIALCHARSSTSLLAQAQQKNGGFI